MSAEFMKVVELLHSCQHTASLSFLSGAMQQYFCSVSLLSLCTYSIRTAFFLSVFWSAALHSAILLFHYNGAINGEVG